VDVGHGETVPPLPPVDRDDVRSSAEKSRASRRASDGHGERLLPLGRCTNPKNRAGLTEHPTSVVSPARWPADVGGGTVRTARPDRPSIPRPAAPPMQTRSVIDAEASSRHGPLTISIGNTLRRRPSSGPKRRSTLVRRALRARGDHNCEGGPGSTPASAALTATSSTVGDPPFASEERTADHMGRAGTDHSASSASIRVVGRRGSCGDPRRSNVPRTDKLVLACAPRGRAGTSTTASLAEGVNLPVDAQELEEPFG